MKQLAIIVTTLLVWQNAFALFDLGNANISAPISSAQMEVIDAYGIYVDIENVRFEKWSQTPSRLFTDLTQINQKRYNYRLIVEDTSLRLEVASVERDGCGSKIITLKETVTTRPSTPGNAAMVYTLIDHSARLCEDYRPYLWVLEMVSLDTLVPENNGKLVIGGNPQAVYKIMAQ